MTAISAEALALSMTPRGIERIRITSREQWLDLRTMDVTASNVAALFGEYPHFGRLGLWELKTGRATDSAATSRAMERGNLFEGQALKELADERPDWRISPLGNRYYFRDPAHRVGATPDAFAIDPARPGFGVVQVKSAVALSKGKWLDEDRQPFCPTWVGLQAMAEAKLTGASWAVVVVIICDTEDDLLIIDVPMPEGLWPAIVSEVDLFWQIIAEGRTPEVDPERDARAVARVFAQDDGTEIDLSGDNQISEILDERNQLKEIEKAGSVAEKARKVLDTTILGKIGHHARARLADGRIITAKTVKRAGFTVAPTSYRSIKVDGSTYAAPARSTTTTVFPERF